MPSHLRPAVPPSRTGRFALALATLLVLLPGCKRREGDGAGGPMTPMQADRAIARAIRSSNEGVILLPSQKAEAIYELPRLNEIAHELRQPAAACFLAAAVQTMEPAANEVGWKGVPDGQVKIRARISPAGHVLVTEVLESGFATEAVPQCVAEAINAKRFPENDTGNTHYVDIVYWVSLGMQAELRGDALARHMRREQAEAAIRAKTCFEGRVPQGGYWIEGLNLVGRDGGTMANRVDQTELPDEVRGCVAQAFRDIRLPPAPDSFVRPVAPRVRFDVLPQGRIRVKDEEWLRLVKLEERARRDKRRAELTADGDSGVGPTGSEGEVPSERVDVVEPAAEEDPASPPDERTEPAPERKGADPGKGGIKLDLSGRGDEQ
jgi:hypothetical protein